ncbi:MAG: ankyrin repeat domain-containing protein [Lactobacillales bacterium]|jgi:cytohesin|nr:ankyrin repeat domain-containing protein [Lactobacillales bacterium]
MKNDSGITRPTTHPIVTVLLILLFALFLLLVFSYNDMKKAWDNRAYYIEKIKTSYKESQKQKPQPEKIKKSPIIAQKPVNEPVAEIRYDFSKNTPRQNTDLLKEAGSKSEFDENKIAALLDGGADVNAKTYGDTIFVDALYAGAPVNIMLMFVKNGADLKYKNYAREDIFTIAAKSASNPEIVGFLIEKGFECKPFGNNAYTPLLYAAAYNKNPQVILEFSKVCDKNAVDGQNENALFFALKNSSENAPEIFQTLVKSGVPVGTTNISGATLLTRAAEKKAKRGVFTALLDAGVNVNIVDKIGYNALNYIYAIDDISIVKLLISAKIDVNNPSKNSKETPLHNAVKYDKNIEFIQVLLDAGADVNARGNAQETPLHTAAKEIKSAKTVEMLLKNGADVNALNSYSQTPLMLAAVRYVDEGIVPTLLSAKNINLEITDSRGETALFYAVGRNADLDEIIKPIVGAGANVNAIRENGDTILIAALRRGNNPETIRYLVESGVDVNQKDALFVAFSQHSNPKVIEALVKGGADLKKTDSAGYTPLAHALNRNHSAETIRVMLDYGAPVNAKTASGVSILELAKSKYNESDEVISMLIAAGAK